MPKKPPLLKMRNAKKLLSNEMLQLALVISLLRIDPDQLVSRFGSNVDSGMDYFDDATGDMWTQTRFRDVLGGLSDMSPTLHHKSIDSMMDRLHTEIMDDLNNLGRYDFNRNNRGYPVEISAYVLNADVNPTRVSTEQPLGPAVALEGDSDSGISDTEMLPSHFGSETSEDYSDREEVSSPDDELPMPSLAEDSELELVGNPREVLGGFLPDAEDLENELVRIDDQLITIEDNLEEISDEFLILDEQMAFHINEEEVSGELDTDDVSHLLDQVDFNANPFDDWQLDSQADLDEILHLSDDLFSEAEKEKSTTSNNIPTGDQSTSFSIVNGVNRSQNVRSRNSDSFSSYNSPPSFNGVADPVHPNSSNNNNQNGVVAIAPSAAEAENHLWTGEGKFEQSSLDDLLRTGPGSYTDGLLRNVSFHNPVDQINQQGTNDTLPTAASASGSGLHPDLGFGGSVDAIPTNSTSSVNNEETSGLESFFGLQSAEGAELIKDLFNALGSTGRDLQDTEGSSTSWSGARTANQNGSSSQIGGLQSDDLGTGNEFNDNFNHTVVNNHGASGSMLPLSGSYGGYNPYFAAVAVASRCGSVNPPYTPFVNHSYAASALSGSGMSQQNLMDDVETASHTSGKSNRSKDFSFDSGSIKQDPDAAERQRQSRDEKKARELGITFSIHDIINLPMDEFNDMLSRHELNEEQLNMCRDIRRRGKNKVAAQNCRKRKIDQINQLEHQVREAKERKRALMAERAELRRLREEWRTILPEIEEEVLCGSRKNTKEFCLDFNSPEVRIVRRMNPTIASSGASSSSDTNFVSSSSYPGRYIWKGSSSGGGNN